MRQALDDSTWSARGLPTALLHHEGCPASLAWPCSEQLKQIGGPSFHRLTAHILSFLQTGDVTFDSLRNRHCARSVYDGIYIILDRERAFDNREHGRHVQIVLARLDCLFNIE